MKTKKYIPIFIIIIGLITLIYIIRKPVDNFEVLRAAYLGDEAATCNFTRPNTGNNQGGGGVFVYIKSGQIKTINKDDIGEDQNIIIKDGITYYWQGKDGVKLIEEEIDLFASLNNRESFNKASQELDIDCRVAEIDDSFFEIPGDVYFEDYTNIDEDYLVEEVIECLAGSGVVVYGSQTCPACYNLEQDFGGYETIKPIYLDCSGLGEDEETQRCMQEMQTDYVPEIQINGELYNGPRTLEDLAREVGC